MKTVIYYNVTTGEAFDQEGTLRTLNNPFTASYGERRTFEWRLVDSTPHDKSVNEWTPRTEWELAPQSAFTAADDNYLAAYPGTLKESVISGAEALTISAGPIPEELAPTGNLRIFAPDHSVLKIPYTSVSRSGDGFIFTADLPEMDLPAGTKADILEEPLVHAPLMSENNSTPEQGIFTFDLDLNGWRLAQKMEYSDLESLPLKGLELCVSGIDPVTEKNISLIRCLVPFVIKNVIALL